MKYSKCGLPVFSTLQALDVWADLEWMYWEGRGAKLYAYRLIPHDPTFAQHNLETEMGREAEAERAAQAATGLAILLDLFLERRKDARVEVDGKRYVAGKGLAPEAHRWRVEISREEG